MRYTIKTHGCGYTEYLEFRGKTYKKEHFGDASSAETEDDDFCDQMEHDGVDDNAVLDKVFDVIDGSFLGFDLLGIADMEWE